MSEKPDWSTAPKWAKFLAMDHNLIWTWWQCEPTLTRGIWYSHKGRMQRASPEAKDTLERRP